MTAVAPRRKFRPATQLVHGGTLRSPFGEMSEALFLTQSFAYPTMEAAEARFKGDDPGFIYSRFSNPTVAMFEQRMCLLEGAEAARATASGMAAVTASMLAQVKAGDHVVAARALFGSCLYVVENLLPQFGVTTTLVDGADSAQWKNAVRKETKLFFLESPTNPTLEVYDLKTIADIAHNAGAKLIVD
ncbi:MAG: aminotransferase class I/II-fold pyridoxal phosphate-dependent enzyme, partial [Alphaproteobacteria bacterium]|nr:aminotransferase class I/II-fold pyridoxal phosphate-dependent enzyme [Alphaproteobacteria bacterium]